MEKTVKNFVYFIGRERFRRILGVTDGAVAQAISRNVLPASWYIVTKEIGRFDGQEIPDELFAMRKRSSEYRESE